MRIAGGSTKGLHTHLFSVHKIKIVNPSTSAQENSEVPPKKKAKKLTNYFSVAKCEEKSLEATLARLTALDGISFNVISSSSDLRAGLEAMAFKNLPKSANTVRKIVIEYSNKLRNSIISEISDKKINGDVVGERFSLSFDEWTSLRNRRYLNIIVHGQFSNFWSLGLARIYGTLPAEKCIELLEEKLAKHKLNLHTDIVAIMTDGASVMKKVGRILSVDQQLCFAHGVQLAVIDVIYNKLEIESDQQYNEEEIYFTESDSSQEQDIFDSDGFLDSSQSRRRNEITETSIGPLINKVRKIISMFRRSPTKNDLFQQYIRAEFGKDIVLLRDCKTRWSSLLSMVERFYLLKDCTQKVLIDIKNTDKSLDLSHDDIQMLFDIITALVPIKTTVEALCRRDSN